MITKYHFLPSIESALTVMSYLVLFTVSYYGAHPRSMEKMF